MDFLRIAASHPDDKVYLEAYGVLMFCSAMALTSYVVLALTVQYPLLESIPDFAAVEALQALASRWGGYELFMFNIGMFLKHLSVCPFVRLCPAHCPVCDSWFLSYC
jgi:hypothetical protein